MNTTIHCVLLTVIVAILGGCSAADQARVRARGLESELLVYEKEQQARVDTINNQYRTAYADLVDVYRQTTDEQRDRLFDADAQRFADDLIDDAPSNTLPSRVRSALGEANAAQLLRLRAHDEALANHEKAYGESYRDLVLALSKIRAARENLVVIADNRNLDKQYAELGKLLVNFARALEAKRKESQTP
jgi:hypothetical protein